MNTARAAASTRFMADVIACCRIASCRVVDAKPALFELGDQQAHRAQMDLCERSARHGMGKQVPRALHEVDVLLNGRELDGVCARQSLGEEEANVD